ncbi:MAG: SpoIIE family protein phosphatase [Bacteroidales bacterium]|nr:SpoIIE family protein phosphatase [Bacteroidales bacterium]
MFKKTLTAFFVLLVISLKLFSQNPEPIAEKGVLDLRNWDFTKSNVELKGEWEFFWNKLYTPEDFENQVHTPDAYIAVPGSWSGTLVNDQPLPDTGYATYRLVIFITPNASQNYMIKFGEILTAYKAWWNNQMITEVGTVNNSSILAIPSVQPLISKVNFDQEKIELIIQISNYSHRANSFFQIPIIGSEQGVIKQFTLNMFFDIIIFGAVFIMGLYHLGLFFYRRKNKAALAFALLSLDVGLRILFSSNYAFPYIFPDISWEIVYRINYFTFYGLVASFIFFFQSTFNEKKYKLFFISSYSISLLFLFTLLLPTLVYSKLLIWYQLSVILMIFFSLFLLVKFIIDKKTGAVTLAITTFLFFAAGINDILYFNDIIKTTTLTHLGLFVLVLGQSLTLARIFTKAFVRNEELTAELDFHNQHLQELVDERTKEIEMQKQDILQKNEELMVQKEELQVQKDEIIRQKDLLLDKNQFITDSIRYASTIQNAILPENENIKKYFNSFFIFLPRDIVSGDFYWFTDTSDKYLFIAVGDCTGHGVPGAFLSLIGMYILNTVVIEKQINDPKLILSKLDELFNLFLHKGLEENRDGMEIGVFRFEKDDLSKLVYSAAKTNIFIYDKGNKEIIRYRGARRSIGLKNSQKSSNVQFENINFDIKSSNIIYCATDGFVDQNNFERKRFGTPAFTKMLNQVSELPMQQQKLSIIRRFEEHRQNEEQRDDVTIIGLAPKINTLNK